MQWRPIKKPSATWAIPPNLLDYDTTLADIVRYLAARGREADERALARTSVTRAGEMAYKLPFNRQSCSADWSEHCEEAWRRERCPKSYWSQ